jgi:L-fucose dehydrogenase
MLDIRKIINFMGKTVMVTGGSMGIGEGCCRVFASAGANVVILARGEKAGLQLRDELRELYPNSICTFISCDVSKEADIQNAVKLTINEFGRIDCLINNAGVHPVDEYIDDITGGMFNDLIQTNLTSMFLFSKYALPYLRETKGSIINMTSLVGSIGQKAAVRYVTTKAGIIGLTKALAIDEARSGVKINCVSPACIETPLAVMIRNTAADPVRQLQIEKDWHQVSRKGDIIEIGTVCLFLASDMAGFMTGVDIPVSGGAELGYGLKNLTD